MKCVSTGYLFSCWIISRISKFIFIHWWASFGMDSKVTFSEVITVNCSLGPLCGPGPSASSRGLCLHAHRHVVRSPSPLTLPVPLDHLSFPFLFPPTLIGSLIYSFSKNPPILCPFLQWVLHSSCVVSPPFLLWVLLPSCVASPPFLLCCGPSLVIFWNVPGTCALESWSPGLGTESPQCQMPSWFVSPCPLSFSLHQGSWCPVQSSASVLREPPQEYPPLAILCGPRGTRRGGARLSQWGGRFLNSEAGHPLASVPLGHREFDQRRSTSFHMAIKCNCISPIGETEFPTQSQVYQIKLYKLTVLTSARMFI